MRLSKILIVGIFLMFLIVACKTEEVEKEKVVELRSSVVFDYAAGFDNGTIFDTSFENVARESGIYDPKRVYGPERATIGEDPLISGMVEALIGMEEGETKNVRIPPEKAYGIKIENSTRTLLKRTFDNPETLEIGGLVFIVTPEGDRTRAFVKNIEDETITIDLNHAFAGEYIQFAILVRSIE